MAPDRAEFTGRYGFPLDTFQVEALDVLDADENVVVAAPTASGKTVVGEYGLWRALGAGERAFYTTPLKALSNQKFRDLRDWLGEGRVGLLTGDTSIDPDADVVVMTTEVLRNMIFGGSRAIDRLGAVVLDEVHFLQDSYRGPVWEEVIIHLPARIRLVCLSATVSNAPELAEWITTVRGTTRAVVETRRPVRLDDRYLLADRTSDRLRLLPTFVDGQPNRQARRLDEMAVRGGSRSRRGPRRRGGNEQRKITAPTRLECIELLAAEGLLPAIYFLFSRNACDDAARSCVDRGVDLNDDSERRRIRRIANDRLGALAADDLEVLGYDTFMRQLTAGVAAHHAGMIPAMKEVVEACFVEGLLKVVFATETLAVGINMPARSVVIEKLSKFTGDHHERLTPGEYTQLTGRAGRRGIDEVGDAIVLWSPWIRFDDVAELASSSAFRLRSAFRPTYNMAANLVRAYSHDEARHLLNLSFAQFQADREIVRLEARLDRRRAVLADLRTNSASEFGDVEEYRRARRDERERVRAARQADRGRMRDALAGLRPGAIVRLDRGDRQGPAVVIATAHRSAGIRLTVIDEKGSRFHADESDFGEPPTPVGSIEMPRTFAPNRSDWCSEIARRLSGADIGPDPGRRRRPGAAAEPTIGHPVERDPDLAGKVDLAARAERVEREVLDLQRRVSAKSGSLSLEFDQVLDLLTDLGYVDSEEFELLPDGVALSRIFHESDLLVAEALRLGLFDELPPADVAALVACIVYEHRSPDPAPHPWFSSKLVRTRWKRLRALSEDLAARERSRGLSQHRPPDPTFAAVAHAWVAGEDFASVVDDEDITGGDFVRNVKQLIDLLRQIALVAGRGDTRHAAAAAADSATRGVIADSSVQA